MPSLFTHIAFPLLVSAVLVGCASQDPATRHSSQYRDPARFEPDVQAFEAADVQAPPPAGAVLCTGSSSIRLWHDTLAADLAPLTVVGRGFGGSNMHDLYHFLDRLVLKHKPRAILIYEGDNDIAQGVPAEHVAEVFGWLLDRIEQELPGCRVYMLAAKPSPARWEHWPEMSRLNAMLAATAQEHGHVTFIDIATPMLGNDGQPRPELFVEDRLHLNRAGYELWRDTIRPVLVQAEHQHEQ